MFMMDWQFRDKIKNLSEINQTGFSFLVETTGIEPVSEYKPPGVTTGVSDFQILFHHGKPAKSDETSSIDFSLFLRALELGQSA